MIESLTVTNEKGDSLEMVLTHPELSGLLISKIDGISPSDATINTTDYGILDGGVYNSARVGTRNITIEFYYLFQPDIETTRHIGYQYFPLKTRVELAFKTDHRTVVASGYIENNDTLIFSEQEKGQISVVCPDPYFYSEINSSYEIVGVGREFEFPFENESLYNPTICFGDYLTQSMATIPYEGDIVTGFVMTVRFLDDDVPNMKVIEDRTNTQIDFDLPGLKSAYGIVPERDDLIIISSIKGDRYITYRHLGNDTNLLAFYYRKIPWFELFPGNNTYYVVATDNLQSVEVKFEFRTIYGGV